MFINQSIWVLESDQHGTTIYAAGSSGVVTTFDVASCCVVSHQNISTGWINGLAYSNNNNTLVVATSRGVLIKLDVDRFRTIYSLPTNYWFNGIKKIKTAKNDSYIVTTAEGNVLFWDTFFYQLNEFPKKHSDQVWSCSISDSGEHLVTCGGNGEIALWDLHNMQFINWFSIGGYTVTSIAFLCKYGMLASVDMGGFLTLWSVKNKRPIHRILAHHARIWNISTSADQRFIVTVGADNRAVVWDLESLQIANEFQMDCPPTACIIQGNSNRVIVGDRKGSIKILDYGKMDRYSKIGELVSFSKFEEHRLVAFIDRNLDDTIRKCSQRLLYTLDMSELPYVTEFVTNVPLLKQSLNRLSGCPLFPQLYLDGCFIGGSEVVSEMVESGALQRLFWNNKNI